MATSLPTGTSSSALDWKQLIANKVNTARTPCVHLNLASAHVAYAPAVKCYRDISVITGDEEVTRAHLVSRLVNELGYRPELIELERPYEAGRPKTITPRIDVIVSNAAGEAFFFIEVKAPDKFESDKQYIDGQLFKLAALHEAETGDSIPYLVYYTVEENNGVFLDKAIVIDHVKYRTYQDWLDDGEPPVGNSVPPHYDKPRKETYIKGGARDLTTRFLPDEIRALATNLHNVLWGGGGTSDTDIFSSLVNIILAKIQDEYDTADGEEYKFQLIQYGEENQSPESLYETLNGLYRTALQKQLYIADSVDDQSIINRQKFPLSKLVYCVSQLEKYSFVDGKSSLNGKDILGDFFEQIQRDGFKQNKGQFFTPTQIVRFMLYGLELDQLALDLLNNEKRLPYIIDPSCGSGTFLIEAMRVLTREVKYRRAADRRRDRSVTLRFEELFLPDNREHRWAREYMYGIEHNFDLATASKVNMILHGDGASNIFKRDGLQPFRFYDKPHLPNVLKSSRQEALYAQKEVNESFDAIFSNPPFSVNLDNDTKRFLGQEFLFGDKKNSENLFIERYYQLLREGGRIAVILPDSVLDTTENKYIRLFLFKYFHVRAIVSLPQTTFAPYTPTKTSIVFAQKKTAAEVKEWNTAWKTASGQFSQLALRVQNCVNVHLNGGDLKSYPSIAQTSEPDQIELLEKLLGLSLEPTERAAGIASLLRAYSAEIADAVSVDSDTKETFGRVNTTWVFRKVAAEAVSQILHAEVDNIGYKRTKRGERETANDLFDVEVAPSKIDLTTVTEMYKEELDSLTAQFDAGSTELARLQGLPKQLKGTTLAIEVLEARLAAVDAEKVQLATELSSVTAALANFYDSTGQLMTAYQERLAPGLREIFAVPRMHRFKSDYVLIRKVTISNVLDEFRAAGIWK